MVNLSNDQEVALSRVLTVLRATEYREAVLAGAAGTGKTTVMEHVLARWGNNVLFLAPTGKAAVRLSEQVKRPAMTIHSALYGAAEEERGQGRRQRLNFGEPEAPEGCGPATLVVVDEASMVNTDLARDVRETILATGAALLWVGDHEQLPPVEGGWGVNLANPTACLTTVHRQALESPVLELATCIRERRGGEFKRWGDEASRVSITDVAEAVAWAEEDTSRVLLTWTNKVRTKANRLTRAARGYEKGGMVVGERIVVTANSKRLGLMNGETFTVASVERCDELSDACGTEVVWVTFKGRAARVLMVPSTFDKFHPKMGDRQIFRWAWNPLFKRENSMDLMRKMGWTQEDLRGWRNAVDDFGVQGTYAYCLTVHKSQGSQYEQVGFVSCPDFRSYEDMEFKRRMSYTAVTRAQKCFRAFTLTTASAA